ncbi:hypothetical protein DFQ27_004276 [Actinomortierella ambigua]|uniref:Zn(2)-C6 fungal-type domain-containing protein n=1 Tax=Actinomortierella ambigua TaxID=1343610 RepID=A0A9P6QM04_9FUNG|nr:hypothetical protein DFQ27_004276 [Actinomortierella ambigua]
MTSVLRAGGMLAVSAPVSAPAPVHSVPTPAPVPVPVPAQTSAPAPAPIPTSASSANLPSTPTAPPARSKPNKVHVPSACINCKKAHLACDISRPCKRCVSVGKDETCRDVEHKKRGRPKLIDKQVEIDTSAWGAQGKEPILSTAGALSKNRTKGKYTKSANYKASRRAGANAVAPPPSSTAPAANGVSMIGAAGPLNPIHTPSTATPSPDATSRTTSHHEAATTSVSPPSYVDHAPHHAQYSRQDYHHHHQHPTPYGGSGGNGQPLDSPIREDKDPFFGQGHYGSTAQPITPQAPVVTLFLSMELICARVSDESQTMWGYHPHDISNKSLHNIISTEDQSKLGHLQRVLKDALFAAANPTDSRHLSHFPFIESTSPVFYQNRPGIMSSIAPGASEVTDVVRVRYTNGGSDLYTIRLYIGGGLGTDLVRRMNIEHAYLVCVMTRYVDQHQHQHQQHHSYQQQQQQQQHAPSHHMTPRSSLDEPERTQAPPLPVMRTSSHSRPSSLYMDEHSAPYPPDAVAAYDDSSSMARSRISLPSLPSVFTGPSSAPLPSPSSYSTRRDSMSLGSPLTPSPSALPLTTSEAQPLASSSSSSSAVSSSSSSLSVLPHTSMASSFNTSSLHTTSRPFASSLSSSSSSSLPPLRTEPLHKAGWLYEPDSFGARPNTPSAMLQSGGPQYGYGSSSGQMNGDQASSQQHPSQSHNGFNNSNGHNSSSNNNPFNNGSHYRGHGHAAGGSRLPSMLSDPFGGFSAPMGGFGVSKYLNRPEPPASFAPPNGRHMLPLPGSLSQRASSSSSSSSLSSLNAPGHTPSTMTSQQLPARSLQRDLSMSAYGATFGAQPPPAVSTALKRPLAEMADRQDRTLDIDGRHHHQDHHGGSSSSHHNHHHRQHHAPSSASSTSSTSSSPLSSTTTATIATSSCASSINGSAAGEPTTTTTTTTAVSAAAVATTNSTSRSIALELQAMPPDHPPVDMSKGAVCPIVHGERMKTQQQQEAPPSWPTPSQPRPMHAYSTHEANGGGGGIGHGHGHGHGHGNAYRPSSNGTKGSSPPCPWAKESQVWSSSKVHPLDGAAAAAKGHGGDGTTTPFSGSPPPSPHHHPYRPTSSTYTYPSQSHHRRSSGTISRPGATGGGGGVNGGGGGGGGGGVNGVVGSAGGARHHFGSAPSLFAHCLSGACGVVCRCHVEDEETRAAKAMEAARKRMSVHSLLC